MSFPELLVKADCQGARAIRTVLLTFDLSKLTSCSMPGQLQHPRKQQGQHLLPLQLQEQPRLELGLGCSRSCLLCLELQEVALDATGMTGVSHGRKEQAPREDSRN